MNDWRLMTGNQVNDTLFFTVQFFQGNTDNDVGHPYYVATCEAISAVTDAPTLAALFARIREVVDLALEDADTPDAYKVTPDPRIFVTLELPENYAETA